VPPPDLRRDRYDYADYAGREKRYFVVDTVGVASLGDRSSAAATWTEQRGEVSSTRFRAKVGKSKIRCNQIVKLKQLMSKLA